MKASDAIDTLGEGRNNLGVYWVARVPKGWQLFAFPGDSRDHSDVWEEKMVPRLAQEWDVREEPLQLLTYAFPRGRVLKSMGKYVIANGEDLKPSMGVDKAQIEQAFGLTGAKWEYDDHERVSEYDKEEIRNLLGIEENWEAVA